MKINKNNNCYKCDFCFENMRTKRDEYTGIYMECRFNPPQNCANLGAYPIVRENEICGKFKLKEE